MLKQYATFFRRCMIVVDMLIVSGAFLLAYRICDHMQTYHGWHTLYPLSKYAWFPPFLSICWGISLYALGMYKSFRLKTLSHILFLLVCAAGIVFLVFTSTVYIFHFNFFSRGLIALGFAFAVAFLSLEKMALMLFFHYLRSKGFNFRNVLIVGTGPRVQEFIKQVEQHREFGFKIIGLVDQDPAKVGKEVCGYPVIGSLEDVQDILWDRPVDNVFFIVPRSVLDRIQDQLRCCETLGISFSVAVDLFDMQFTMGQPDTLMGLPIITFESVSQKHYQLIFKRLLDIGLSGAALIALSPLFALISLLIKATSSGPSIFAQERCSLNGRRFKLFKFRTMGVDAESKLKDLMAHNQMAGPAFKMDNDPRITPVGKILRKFSLDELPQLWNVLHGDMSLVGPRPPLPSEVQHYGLWHRRRLSMRPGITCLWQVSGRNKITDFDEWAKLDLKYIDEWSLALDFNILLRTVPAVLSTSGAK